MYLFHIAFSLALITFICGAYTYVWACRETARASGFGKFIGIAVMLITLGNLACISCYGYKQWRAGYYDVPPVTKSAGIQITY